MTSDVVKNVETRNVGLDDQQLAEINAEVAAQTKKRAKINTGLRRLYRMRKAIIERRELTDATV